MPRNSGFHTARRGAVEVEVHHEGEVVRASALVAHAGAGDVLLHGDFYPGSWLRHGDGVRVIDPEFGFIGAAEFDLGGLRAHLAFIGVSEAKLDAALAGYPGEVDAGLVRGFAGVERLRRLLGVAQLPLDADLERKAGWVERALADLETT